MSYYYYYPSNWPPRQPYISPGMERIRRNNDLLYQLQMNELRRKAQMEDLAAQARIQKQQHRRHAEVHALQNFWSIYKWVAKNPEDAKIALDLLRKSLRTAQRIASANSANQARPAAPSWNTQRSPNEARRPTSRQPNHSSKPNTGTQGVKRGEANNSATHSDASSATRASAKRARSGDRCIKVTINPDGTYRTATASKPENVKSAWVEERGVKVTINSDGTYRTAA